MACRWSLIAMMLVAGQITGVASPPPAAADHDQTAMHPSGPMPAPTGAARRLPFHSPPAGLDDALVIAISAWLASEFGTTVAERMPTVAFSSPDDLIALRYGSLAMDLSPDRKPDVLALYDDRRRVVHLSSAWTGRTPADLSILVHELVHHAQAAADERFACPEEREKAAFEAQQRWLTLFGADLETAFGLDPFTILVRTTCAP
ncbi:MAG TPA: DUF6647 family protein [Methylomirabilota bacterium]|nr:DUF6647 family protein [Methylomirabilota bacterium]